MHPPEQQIKWIELKQNDELTYPNREEKQRKEKKIKKKGRRGGPGKQNR